MVAPGERVPMCRDERNPGITFPLNPEPAKRADRIMAPLQGTDILSTLIQGVARPAVAYPWLPSATATRLVEHRNQRLS
jgi:hypothetical protein